MIVPDLRGMGMSDHPDTGYTKKNQAVDITGVMDALKVQNVAAHVKPRKSGPTTIEALGWQ